MYKAYKVYRKKILHKISKRDVCKEEEEPQKHETILTDVTERCRQLLRGNLGVRYPRDSKVVRIFTSSTFSDTKYERNALMERVYPKLKDHCRQKGYEFQVVDMRWGVRENATIDHATTDLCLKELQDCKAISTGPYLVTFLSHRYGSRPLQRVIKASEYHELLNVVSENDKQLLECWYKLDENVVPPCYILRPITDNLPDFSNYSSDVERKKAKLQWDEQSGRLTETLYLAARKVFHNEQAHKYQMSVTERELQEGLLSTDARTKYCFVFYRNITDFDKDDGSKWLGKYTEASDLSGKNKALSPANQLLDDLKVKISKHISEDNIRSYSVSWVDILVNREKGLETESLQDYLGRFCNDFEKSLKTSIDNAIVESDTGILPDTLHWEVLQHIELCKEMCAVFYGRNKLLKEIQNEILTLKNVPYVIHGRSGSGKSSLLARIAYDIRQWLAKDIVLILRFIGTTLQSSSLRLLLLSIMDQISTQYSNEGFGEADGIDMEMNDLIQKFHDLLKLPTSTNPLVIILDSLDQFSNYENPQALEWVPKELPENVIFVLSTLPDTDTKYYGYLPALESMFLEHPDRFLDVPDLDAKDAELVARSWLKSEGRNLTNGQLDVIQNAFEKCKLPLFLKLCLDEACRWTSYAQISGAVLQSTLENAIFAMFSQMRRKHGDVLASRTFTYLTASRNGLSQTELEDILSCDEDVLDDVYQYWTPPVRILPPLLLVRLKRDISQYLVERGDGGTTVIVWNHQQFSNAARKWFLKKESFRQAIHHNIAKYFLDEMGFKDNKRNYLAPQPLKVGKLWNLRKLNELPYHLVEADMFNDFNLHVTMNLEWHFAKIKALSYRHLIADLSYGIESMSSKHDCTEWSVLYDTLCLSQAVIDDGRADSVCLLPSQVIGRISQGLDSYRQQCIENEGIKLLPITPSLVPPGGELKHRLAGHTKMIRSIDMTHDGKYAVTGGQGGKIRIWNLGADAEQQEQLGLIKTGTVVLGLLLCNSDQYIAAFVGLQKMMIFHLKTRQRFYSQTFKTETEGACTVYDQNTHLAIASRGEILLFDVKRRRFLKENTMEYSTTVSRMSGSKSTVCALLDKSSVIQIYDASKENKKNEIQSIEIPQGTYSDVSCSPDGKKVMAFGQFFAELFDIKTGERLQIFDIDPGYEVLIDQTQRANGRFISDSLFIGARALDVVILNVDSSVQHHLFQHPARVIQVVSSVKANRVVSIAEDRVVRVWKPKGEVLSNNSRSSPESTTIEKIKKKQEREETIELLPIPDAARYLLVHTQTHQKTLSNFRVFDTQENSILRMLKFPNKVVTVRFSSATAVVVCDENFQLHRISLVDMELKQSYPMLCGSACFYVVSSESGKEAVCISKKCSSVRVIDLETIASRTINVTGSKHKSQLSPQFTVSQDGSVGVFPVLKESRATKLVVLDLRNQSRTVRYKLKLTSSLEINNLYITADKRHLAVLQSSLFEGGQCSVWDLAEGKGITEIDKIDVRSHCYERQGKFELFTNKSLECKMKIYDLITGKRRTARYKNISDFTFSKNVAEEEVKYCVLMRRGTYMLCDLGNLADVAKFKADSTDWINTTMIDNWTIATSNKVWKPNKQNIHVLQLYNGSETKEASPSLYSNIGEENTKHIEMPLSLDKEDTVVDSEFFGRDLDFDPDIDDDVIEGQRSRHADVASDVDEDFFGRDLDIDSEDDKDDDSNNECVIS